MPPKKENHLTHFTTITFGVERRISQLLNYIRSLVAATVGEMQERILMDFNRNLREAMDNCQLTWLDRRDEIHPISREKIRKLVDSTVHMGEAALRKAERFVAERDASNRKPPKTPTMDKPDRLDNTGRMPPTRHDARGGPDLAPEIRQMVRMERPDPGKERPGHAKGNIGELSR